MFECRGASLVTGVLSALAAVTLSIATPVHAADDTPKASGADADGENTLPRGAPIVGYTYGAHGVASKTVGASTYGTGLGAGGGQKTTFGLGFMVWGSPLDRLTLIVDGARDVFGEYTPSAAAHVRLLGNGNEGWALSALGKFKIDGFARGPAKEVESEVESGVLLSYARRRLHFDLNAIGGVGLGDDGEIDSEGRLRVGYDVTELVRIGIDEQARFRLAGRTRLPGNRTWDFAGGGQVMLHWRNFFGAFTAGPTTMGVTDQRVGWMALLSLGGTTVL